jgi:predicted  nucleic acid-binding Zn-ribbon protein
MPLALPAGLLALSAALAFALALGWRRRERALSRELETLHERLQELSLRLEAAEQDAAEARTQSTVNEGLLLEKGIADEDELEDARRRLVEDDPPREGDDALH